MGSFRRCYYIRDVCESYLGGYIIIGEVYDIFASPFIANINETGTIVNPITDDYLHGRGIMLCRTFDGNNVAVYESHNRFGIEKINNYCGNMFWFGTATYLNAQFSGIAATNDYGIMTIGADTTASYNMAVAVYDSAGNFSWWKEMGGSAKDMANSGCQAVNGNYLLAGYTFSNDGDVSGNHGG